MIIGEAEVALRPDTSTFASDAEDAGGGFGSAVLSGIGTTLKVGLGAVGIAGGAVLGTALFSGFNRLTAIQDAQAKLSGLGHSAAEVDTIMDNALKSVQGTAFGLDEAATVAAGAVAAGVKPGQDLTKELSLVADAATIGGTSLSDMGAIFNKVAASGKIQGDVIAQLNDQGIPIIQLLSKELGVSAQKTVELASQGKVSFEDFRKAMESGLGGAALKSGQTVTGAFKNIHASLSRIGAGLLGGVFPKIAPFFQSLLKSMAPLEDAAGKLGNRIGQVLAPQMKALEPIIHRVLGGFADSIKGFVRESRNFNLSSLTKGSGQSASSLRSIGSSFKALLPAAKEFAQQLPSVADTLKVTAAVMGFFAKHVDTLIQLMPLLVAAFVAYKAAQAAQSASAVLRIPLLFGQVVATRQLATANVNLAAAIEVQTAAQTGQNVAAEEGVVVENQGTLARIRGRIAILAQAVAQRVAAVASKAWAAAQWLLNAALDANPIGFVIIAVAALVAGLIEAYKHSETFRNIVNAVFTFLKNVVVSVLNFIVGFVVSSFNNIKTFVSVVLAAVVSVLKTYVGIVRAVWTAIWRGLTAVVSFVFNLVRTVITTYINAYIAVFRIGLNAIRAVWNAVWRVFAPVVRLGLQIVLAYVRVVWNGLKVIFLTGARLLKTYWTVLWRGLVVIARATFGAVRAVVSTVIGAVLAIIRRGLSIVRAVWSAVWRNVSSIVKGVWGVIQAIIRAGVAFVQREIRGFQVIIGYVRGVFDSVVSSIREKIDAAITVVKGIKDRITGFFDGAKDWLLQAGKDIIQGLIDGIGSMFGAVKSKFDSLTSHLPGWKGPPERDKKLLNSAGQLIMAGLVDGFDAGTAAVKSKLSDVSDLIAGGIRTPAVNVSTAGDAVRRRPGGPAAAAAPQVGVLKQYNNFRGVNSATAAHRISNSIAFKLATGARGAVRGPGRDDEEDAA